MSNRPPCSPLFPTMRNAARRRLFGEEVLRNLRAAVVNRYQLLPFLYTLFAEASHRGLPVNRPMWMHYPTDAATFAMDDQFLVGSDLLVKARSLAPRIVTRSAAARTPAAHTHGFPSHMAHI